VLALFIAIKTVAFASCLLPATGRWGRSSLRRGLARRTRFVAVALLLETGFWVTQVGRLWMSYDKGVVQML
jgi:hypothetical protein